MSRWAIVLTVLSLFGFGIACGLFACTQRYEPQLQSTTDKLIECADALAFEQAKHAAWRGIARRMYRDLEYECGIADSPSPSGEVRP